jgi:hypothetical protein
MNIFFAQHIPHRWEVAAMECPSVCAFAIPSLHQLHKKQQDAGVLVRAHAALANSQSKTACKTTLTNAASIMLTR